MRPPIRIEGQDMKARLAQEFHVLHTPNEFLLSILEVIPQMAYFNEKEAGKISNKLQSAGILQKVVGRYVMSPAAMKKLAHVLSKNLEQFEKKFGEIVINPPEGLQ